MKLNLITLAVSIALPSLMIAQKNQSYPNTFSSGSANISKFTNGSKRFNDWSISAGAGVPLLQSADLTSIKNGNGKNVFGYSYYFSVDKEITHAFGLNLQYDGGETRQGAFNTKTQGSTNGSIAGRTQYQAISLLTDFNLSNLLRRVDNKSPYRWAMHGYAGVGVLAFRAYQANASGEKLMTEIKPFNLNSLFYQVGAAVKFKLSRRFDLSGRLMYVVTGDDSFDGGGPQYSTVNQREDQVSDNFFNPSLGVTVNLGKQQSSLFWHDPLQEIYYKLDVLADATPDVEVCNRGDNDNDAVCDDWDRQLNTPAGARVDGAGVALDTDLDGVIDLYDKCVTVPGPVDNKGCPSGPQVVDAISKINEFFQGIEFALNSDVIRPKSFAKLDQAAEIAKTLNSNDKFYVIGCTDTSGRPEHNKILSQKRAAAVVDYLTNKGVSRSMLIPDGRGQDDLKYPECNPWKKCPDWKNEANRRVYFEKVR